MESTRTCCLDWRFCKIVGLTIGWLGVLANFGLIYGLCQHTGRSGGSLHETIIAFLPEAMKTMQFDTLTGLNFVASYSWLFGISRSKSGFMLASLIWWGTNVCLLLTCVYSYILTQNEGIHRPTKSEAYFSVATVYWICTFFVAIICYLSAKDNLQKSPVNV